MTRQLNAEYEAVSVESLVAHPDNPRRGDVDAIAESIRANGWFGTLLVQRSTRHVLVGNHRLQAARNVGLDEVPVVWADVDDTEARRIMLADNRASDLAGYDDSELLAVLSGLNDVSGLAGTLYDDTALAELLRVASSGRRTNEDLDAAPGVPTVPVTAPGDVWVLGEHRLLCGDSTKRAEVEGFLNGETPDLLLTDPPYGVSHGSGITKAKPIRGDIGQAVVPIGFAVALGVLSDNARLYVFGGCEQMNMYLGLWDHHLGALPRLVVWVKESFVLRQNGYHAQFELVYWGWKGSGGGPAYWYGDRRSSDVWQVARDGNHVHPTQKPVALLRVPLERSLPVGGVAFDPFAGSGSTLIAAHATGRVARLIEIAPGYCDVICRRFQAYAGVVPVLERTGEPVDFAPLELSTVS